MKGLSTGLGFYQDLLQREEKQMVTCQVPKKWRDEQMQQGTQTSAHDWRRIHTKLKSMITSKHVKKGVQCTRKSFSTTTLLKRRKKQCYSRQHGQQTIDKYIYACY
ncbi:hypothetical protein OIU84_005070 [Salix udensis]|uniref:Uncharacterized protein n=1 Tax=Salix udensis TaxID=889485 RepID=A0AAD6JVJ0_9ROSI|nr:hypothetical protein OIU84_005070 [Salix udensis]